MDCLLLLLFSAHFLWFFLVITNFQKCERTIIVVVVVIFSVATGRLCNFRFPFFVFVAHSLTHAHSNTPTSNGQMSFTSKQRPPSSLCHFKTCFFGYSILCAHSSFFLGVLLFFVSTIDCYWIPFFLVSFFFLDHSNTQIKQPSDIRTTICWATL